MSIPAGTHTDGRPRSVQIIAGRGQDNRLLKWADELQQGLNLHIQETTFASS